MIGIGINISINTRRGRRSWTPADDPSLLSWVRGDDPGASINTTPDPDQYAAIPDRGSLGGQYEQATSANQPALSTLLTPSPVPLFGGGTRLQHTAAASAWNAAHNPTGNVLLAGVFVCVGALTFRQIFSTYNGGTTSRGVRLYSTSAGALGAQFGNGDGSGSANTSIESAAGIVTAGALVVASMRKIGADVTLRAGFTQIATGVIASPATGNAQYSATVGAADNGTLPHVGVIGECCVFSGANLPTDEQIETYLANRWSLTP